MRRNTHNTHTYTPFGKGKVRSDVFTQHAYIYTLFFHPYYNAATDGHLICVLDKPLEHECSGVRAAASVCEVQHITGQRSAERPGYSEASL